MGKRTKGERMLEGVIGAASDLEKGVIVSAECSELGEETS